MKNYKNLLMSGNTAAAVRQAYKAPAPVPQVHAPDLVATYSKNTDRRHYEFLKECPTDEMWGRFNVWFHGISDKGYPTWVRMEVKGHTWTRLREASWTATSTIPYDMASIDSVSVHYTDPNNMMDAYHNGPFYSTTLDTVLHDVKKDSVITITPKIFCY